MYLTTKGSFYLPPPYIIQKSQQTVLYSCHLMLAYPWVLPGDREAYACNARDLGLMPGEMNGYPLQYSCLENSVDRGDWSATVHGVAKSWTWLSYYHYPWVQYTVCPCLCVCVIKGQVMSDSLQPHELYLARLLCPWDFSCKSTGEGCHFPIPGDLLHPRIDPACLVSPELTGRFFFTTAPPGKPCGPAWQLSFLWYCKFQKLLSFIYLFSAPVLSCYQKNLYILKKFITQCLLVESIYSWLRKDWCWSWNLNIFATWYKELTHLKRPRCWERLKAGGEGDDRGWDD